VIATHDAALVDWMRRRVVELDQGTIVRDQARGVYGIDATSGSVARTEVGARRTS
jgi:cell division transport system ATP-binding protein